MTSRLLMLETVGRNSGQPHRTPLQFEQIGNELLIGSARGEKADWFKNIQNNPMVMIDLGQGPIQTLAHPVTDPDQILDFLELRRRRHPMMMQLLLLSEGLPANPTRAQLFRYAQQLAMVIVQLPDRGEIADS